MPRVVVSIIVLDTFLLRKLLFFKYKYPLRDHYMPILTKILPLQNILVKICFATCENTCIVLKKLRFIHTLIIDYAFQKINSKMGNCK